MTDFNKKPIKPIKPDKDKDKEKEKDKDGDKDKENGVDKDDGWQAWWNPFRWMNVCFHHYHFIIVKHGNHTIDIPLKKHKKIRCVWICIDEPDNIPVCQGNVNKVGYQIVNNHLIIYADIKTDIATIRYVIR